MINFIKERDGVTTIVAPRDIRFISDWKEFNFSIFPEKCIIDKQIPGCGYTEWCIRNNQNVILCSPRKILLENKTDQHSGEVFLVVNELDKDPDIDRKTSTPSRAIPPSLGFDELPVNDDIYNKIYNEYIDYINSRGNMPHKILVTYDSYYIVKKILQFLGTFDTFYTVVDEFQVTLSDSRFKSTTELEFMSVISGVQKVHFVSATPMLEKYIQMLDDFKDLPYYRIDWAKEDSLRVSKPSLKILLMRSIGEVIQPIIQSYKDGKFEKIDYDGKEVVSDEAVFYLNSVNHIINIIKKYGLQPSECNILCARTPENAKRIKTRLGRKWIIGSVPLKGEKSKMFTFCTRTVYLGADFYSTCARSFVFSDSNTDCLSIDISMDLPQILGRQRLSENPWKNSAIFYYRTTADYRKMSKEDFDKVLQNKTKSTNNLLSNYEFCLNSGQDVSDLVKQYSNLAKTYLYKENYVAVNKKASLIQPVFNNYVYVSEIRAFDIQQIDYADRFSVFSEIYSSINDSTELNVIRGCISQYESLNNNISDRLKYICGLDDSIRDQFLGQLNNDDYAKSYYLQLGASRCRALGYNVSRIRNELGIIKFDMSILEKEIYSNFNVGDRLKKADIKNTLKNIYSSLKYEKPAKATDIENWFTVELTYFTENGKRSVGYRLIKKK